jgi:hypothetical protein
MDKMEKLPAIVQAQAKAMKRRVLTASLRALVTGQSLFEIVPQLADGLTRRVLTTPEASSQHFGLD